jgi:hypothetical protein
MTRPSQHAALEPTGIRVSGRTNSKDANPAEEENHCFKFHPEADLELTISAADNNSSFPKSGRVTVEIINLQLLDSARAGGPLTSGLSPTMKYELETGTIKSGQAIVTFKGDLKTNREGGFVTVIHLGTLDHMINDLIGSPYSNVALITLPGRRNTANVEPVKYVYYYKVYTKQPSECTQKP